MSEHGKTKVLIAGGGVAALEAALALRELASDDVQVELLSPERYFSYRPLAVVLPFEHGETIRFELTELAGEIGASVTHGALTGVDTWRHVAYTSTNREIEYDVLLVACGALPMPAIRGAQMFRGLSDVDLVRRVLDEIARGEVNSLAFVVPSGATWSLPAYELALLAGTHVRPGVELWLVTPELEPLQLFGRPASDAVRDLLAARGVGLRTAAYVERFADGQLELLPEGSLTVDRVVALPRLVGAPIDGVPQTLDGFIPVDEHGRVHGVADVYAAGDITSFPVKHGGLATQQALAAAEMIAASAGCDVDPQPFRPVVHGLLLTGRESRFLRRELGGQPEHEPAAAYEPLWWPPAKVVGRHIGPFLASLAGGSERSLERPPEEEAVPVEVSLGPEFLKSLDVRRFPVELDDADEEAEPAGVSSVEVVLVAPEDTLGEVAEHLLQQELSAVLVSEYGRLIGILTTHDLMRALAARANPSEARARQWMTAEPITVDATTARSVAARLMRAHEIHHLPLVEHDRPVGMLHLDLDHADAIIPIGLGF